MDTCCLSTKNVSIEFPGVKALDDISFSTQTGSVHAVVGANGAGKSTLMKVLTGTYNTYTGEIAMDGQAVHIRSPYDAQKHGIQIVHQEVDAALAPALSVAENIMINELVSMQHKQFVNWKKIQQGAREKLDILNVKIDVKRPVKELTLAEKQLVLIARALMHNIKFLILDEPTAPLSNTETEQLFKVVRDLAARNVGVIFISHRLPEIFEICDSITIMRDGKIVANEKVTNLDVKTVVSFMLGREFGNAYPKQKVAIGDVLMEVQNLTTTGGEVRDINMHVRAGEIVGVAGLVGAGKSELCKTIFGDIPIQSGEIRIHGKRINNRTPSHAVNSGLSLVPEERRKEGILIHEPIYSNISAAKLSQFCNRFGFIRKNKEKELAGRMIQSLGIKCPNCLTQVQYLSGGNQQKVAIAKWLAADAEVYLMDEPTKGVDVGAKQDIFRLIGDLTAKGKGVIYATCEFSEILGITDRIYVMYDNTIVGELVTAKTNEQELLYATTGGK